MIDLNTRLWPAVVRSIVAMIGIAHILRSFGYLDTWTFSSLIGG